MKELILYTRPACGLCEDAEAMLSILQQEYEFKLSKINIEDDDRLLEKFHLEIPVLVSHGHIIAKGSISWDDVERLLKEQ
ncbi:glutaredoxin family protein [Bacillaceae bacterium SIJ1]|uniref:glutaredoxin family protein n=1 Tax=Litoribacterium kuwaitense TaxID=1398745 RepID=UPI0013ED28C2|nr:glutaredoxin family protein [Litoribacterium kuwaitense]NGP45321.1 glutaredoxin family protein [Litoribacterium kuwaitense]